VGNRRRSSLSAAVTALPQAPVAPRALAMLLEAALPWLAVAAASSAGAALWPSPGWAVLALLGFGGFSVSLARASPASTILLAPLLLLTASQFASGVAIESGAAMTETGRMGSPSGAFAHLLMLHIVLLTASAWPIELGWRTCSSRTVPIGQDWRDGAGALQLLLGGVIGLASVTLALLAARHGVPLLGGHDRFTYLGRLDGTPYRSIIMNRPVIAPLVGILLAVRDTRRAGALLVGWLLLVSILFGEKFTSLLLILAGAGIAPLLATLAGRGSLPLRPLLAGALLLGGISLPVVMLTYGALADSDRAWVRLGDRAAVQGELWYLADRAGPPPGIDFPALRADVLSWANPAAQHAERAGPRFGLYYVMARFTPSHRLKQAERSGTGFVFALHPYLLLAGGVPLLLVGGLAVALFHGWVLALLLQSLAERRWLAALAFARIINATYAGLFTGYLWDPFGIKSAATLALGLVLLRLVPLRIITVDPKSINNSSIRV
jgi:hypothetical protein